MRARHRVWAGWGIVGLSALGIVAACTAENTLALNGGVIGPGTTSISVDPTAFLTGGAVYADAGAGAGATLHTVLCSNMPGTMQSYVATVTDKTLAFEDGGAGFVMPSSSPTLCAQSVYFEYVVVGDTFTATVDGYEQAAGDLAPACSFQGIQGTCAADSDCPAIYGCGGTCTVAYDTPKLVPPNPESLRGEPCNFDPDAGKLYCVCSYTSANGERQMYYPLDSTLGPPNTPVTPRWKTQCGLIANGVVDGGVMSVPYANVSIAPCLPMTDQGGAATPTEVVVDPESALGALACAGDAGSGTVTAFDVIPSDPALSPVTGFACQAAPDATVAFVQGLVIDRSYVFTLNAYVAGRPSPAYTSHCYAAAHAGTTVTAVCDPLAAVADGGVDGGDGGGG